MSLIKYKPPKSINKLDEQSFNYQFNYNIDYIIWLKKAQNLYQTAIYEDENNLNYPEAYVLYKRYIDLLINKLPNHPNFQQRSSYIRLINRIEKIESRITELKPLINNEIEIFKKNRSLKKKQIIELKNLKKMEFLEKTEIDNNHNNNNSLKPEWIPSQDFELNESNELSQEDLLPDYPKVIDQPSIIKHYKPIETNFIKEKNDNEILNGSLINKTPQKISDEEINFTNSPITITSPQRPPKIKSFEEIEYSGEFKEYNGDIIPLNKEINEYSGEIDPLNERINEYNGEVNGEKIDKEYENFDEFDEEGSEEYNYKQDSFKQDNIKQNNGIKQENVKQNILIKNINEDKIAVYIDDDEDADDEGFTDDFEDEDFEKEEFEKEGFEKTQEDIIFDQKLEQILNNKLSKENLINQSFEKDNIVYDDDNDLASELTEELITEEEIKPDPTDVSHSFTEGGLPLKTLYVPISIQEDFLKISEKNTLKNLETCGILCGKLINDSFYLTELVIPEQVNHENTCKTINELNLFNYIDNEELFIVGWIHTHPSQNCFLSSIDLHTQNGYQLMLPESIAIVLAPNSNDNINFGIFRLIDPNGINIITKCEKSGFHRHEENLEIYTIINKNNPGHIKIQKDLSLKITDIRNLEIENNNGLKDLKDLSISADC